MADDLQNQRELNEELRNTLGLTNDLSEAQQNVANDVLSAAQNLRGFKTEQADIRSITRKINKLTSETLSLNTSSLGTTKSLNKLLNDQKKLQTNVEALVRQKEKFEGRSGIEAQQTVSALEDQVEQAKIFNEALNKSIQASKNLRGNFGVGAFSGIASFLKEIPLLGKLAGPFEEAAEKARSIAVSSENLGKKGFFGKLGVGVKSFIGGLGELAAGLARFASAALLGLIVSAFSLLDKSSGAIAKQLGISTQEALNLSKEFNQISLDSENIFINTKNLTEAQVALSKALGTNNQFSTELLITQTELTKQAGYSVETATQLSKLQLITGKSSKNITTEFLGQAKALNLQNDLSLTEKDLLEGINQISKGTLAVFSSQPKELAKAVFQAKALGLSVQQLEKSANSLLDIENSIAAEFEAEVISGRQLNLEQARYAALTNDIAKVGEELGKQGYDLQAFTEATVIEQEAMAKAIGLSRDELGASLMEQQAIKNIGAANAEELKKQYLEVKGTAKEQEFLNSLGNEQYAQQLASTTQAEQFTAVVGKLKEAFVSIAEPLMNIITPIINILSPALQGIATFVDAIKTGFQTILPILKPISVILGIMYARSLAVAIATAAKGIFQALGGLPVVGPALALAAIGAAATKIKADSKPQQAGDAIIPASGGPTISTREGGLIQGTSNDDILMAPGIARGTNRNAPSNVTVTLSKTDIQSIADAVRDGASRATINLDGDRVSSRLQTPTVLNNLPPV